MADLLSQVLVAFNVIGVVSATIFFVSRMGSKIERLGEAIDHLASAHERQYADHEARLRALEHHHP